MLTLLVNCVKQPAEPVARIGVEGFKQLMLLTGDRCGEMWMRAARSLRGLFEESLPHMLTVEGTPLPGNEFDPQQVVTYCVVQLLLIDLVAEVTRIHFDCIPPEALMVLLDSLEK